MVQPLKYDLLSLNLSPSNRKEKRKEKEKKRKREKRKRKEKREREKRKEKEKREREKRKEKEKRKREGGVRSFERKFWKIKHKHHKGVNCQDQVLHNKYHFDFLFQLKFSKLYLLNIGYTKKGSDQKRRKEKKRKWREKSNSVVRTITVKRTQIRIAANKIANEIRAGRYFRSKQKS